MKKATVLLLGIAFLSSCKNTTNEISDQASEIAQNEKSTKIDPKQERPAPWLYAGDSISPEGAVPPAQLLAMMEGKDSLAVKVTGTIISSCAKKGCWMKMDLGNGEEMRVSFKDYGFFVPKDLNGETAVIDGIARVEEISVDDLRHFAEDGGQSKEEIAAITEPQLSLTYVAHGVMIQREG